VPFVRVSHDKRGYDQTWLLHASSRKGRPSRAHVLYWFRSPAGARVGRRPFDESVRRQLEARYPDIAFDWEQLTAATDVPPPEVEPWRERRQARRSAQRPRDEETAAKGDKPPPETQDPDAPSSEATAEPSAVEGTAVADAAPRSVSKRRRRGGRRRRRPEGTVAPEPSPTDRSSPSSDS
jgi:hypothetical protein